MASITSSDPAPTNRLAGVNVFDVGVSGATELLCSGADQVSDGGQESQVGGYCGLFGSGIEPLGRWLWEPNGKDRPYAFSLASRRMFVPSFL